MERSNRDKKLKVLNNTIWNKLIHLVQLILYHKDQIIYLNGRGNSNYTNKILTQL